MTITPLTLTDKTGCPGFFCPYLGSDLIDDASHVCKLRTSGAENWEAYIKDVRDDNIYHITQFSNDSWWFADGLAYVATQSGSCNGISVYGSANRKSCPFGWRLPTQNEAIARWVAPNTSNNQANDPWGSGLFFARSVAGECYPITTYFDVWLDECENSLQWKSWDAWGWCGNAECAGGCADFDSYVVARCMKN